MPRIQILELPEGTGDDRPPFVLVVDEWTADSIDTHNTLDGYWDAFGKKIGASAVLFTDQTMHIPANDVPLDADGNPLVLKMHVEGDFEQFREQVQDEIRKAQEQIRQVRP